MNINKLSAAFFMILFAALAGCDKDNEFREVKVTEVNTLYSPDNGRNVVLQATTTSTLYFEWEPAVAEDNGVVYYDVVFDKADGDFSNPLYVVPADNKGTSTGASITHKVLNKIGRLAGIPAGQEGILKWTVASSRGLTGMRSTEARTINVTRINGLDAPDVLYLTGEGTEAGATLAQALTMKALTSGYDFEIYTKLQAGKKYAFVDSKTNVSRTFSVNPGDTTFKESADGGTIAKDGIYKISLNFVTATVTIKEITKLDFFMCTPEKRTTLAYEGKGIWRVVDMVPDFTTNWGDDRYFFWITIGGKEQKLGSFNRDNQPPAGTTGSYFDLNFYPNDTNRWDYSFKFPNRSVKKCTITVSLSSEAANFAHEILY